MDSSVPDQSLADAMTRGDYATVVRVADEILSRKPAAIVAIRAKAMALAMPGSEVWDDQAAVATVKAAMLRQPGHTELDLLLAQVLDLLGDSGEASHVYRDLISREPQCYDALWGLALLQGYPEVDLSVPDALHLLDRAIEADPVRWEAHLTKAQALKRVRRVSEARTEYDAALARIPEGDRMIGMILQERDRLG
jgi:Flp pilus assembly protein TadD